jgi:hypothetical protein
MARTPVPALLMHHLASPSLPPFDPRFAKSSKFKCHFGLPLLAHGDRCRARAENPNYLVGKGVDLPADCHRGERRRRGGVPKGRGARGARGILAIGTFSDGIGRVNGLNAAIRFAVAGVMPTRLAFAFAIILPAIFAMISSHWRQGDCP